MALPKHSIRKGGHAGRGIDHGLLIAKAKVMARNAMFVILGAKATVIARNAVFVILGALAVAWLLEKIDPLSFEGGYAHDSADRGKGEAARGGGRLACLPNRLPAESVDSFSTQAAGSARRPQKRTSESPSGIALEVEVAGTQTALGRWSLRAAALRS
jgi:hypothetical protein